MIFGVRVKTLQFYSDPQFPSIRRFKRKRLTKAECQMGTNYKVCIHIRYSKRNGEWRYNSIGI